MSDESLERIELKIAYLENANNELSAVVFRQQQEIDALRLRLTAMTARLEEMQTKADEWTAEQEKPPHY